MIMVPSQNYNFPIRETTIHGGYLASAHMNHLSGYYHPLMAQDQDQVGPSYSKSKSHEDDDDEEEEERCRDWLQLGIGHSSTMVTNLDPLEVTKRRNLIELDLLSDKPNKQLANPFYHMNHLLPPPPPPIPSQPQPSQPPLPLIFQNQAFLQKPSFGLKQQEITWSFRSILDPWNPTTSTTSNPFYSKPYQHPHVTTSFQTGPSSTNLKLVDAPSRPQSGLWFMLQASQNQTKEPVLPQIPKNYLRIKDGKMTILMLMKYLANKLELNSESEIEITCRGQQLLPTSTLRHVRDTIWCSGDPVTLIQGSQTSDHVMILNYARSA